MEVIDIIKNRRSVRRFKSTPVDDQTLELVLEAARWAPSWANTQCCRLVVVRDANIKDKLVGILRSARPDGKNAATEAVRNAPVVIVACAELQKSGYFHGGPTTDKGDWYMFDVALAMQNLVLAASSVGLGTVYVGLFDAKKASEILGVPPGFCVVALTPLGYPDQELTPRPKPSRKELAEIVFYNRFGGQISGQ